MEVPGDVIVARINTEVSGSFNTYNLTRIFCT